MFVLNENEKIIKIIRRHWFVFFIQTIGIIFFWITPIVGYFFVSKYILPFEASILSNDFGGVGEFAFSLFLFAMSAWTLLLWITFFAIWTNYYLDVWIVTNKRIIDIEQISFFKRDVSTFRIEQIQDMTLEVHGLFATLLDYGNIHVQTAGANREFKIHDIPKPKKLKEIILREYEKKQNKLNKI